MGGDYVYRFFKDFDAVGRYSYRHRNESKRSNGAIFAFLVRHGAVVLVDDCGHALDAIWRRVRAYIFTLQSYPKTLQKRRIDSRGETPSKWNKAQKLVPLGGGFCFSLFHLLNFEKPDAVPVVPLFFVSCSTLKTVESLEK